MTDRELKALAKDFWAGKVFTDRQVEQQRDIPVVFMCLALMDEEDLTTVHDQLGATGMIYEYLDKALPRQVNGMPIFLSCRILRAEHAERFWKYCKEVREAMDAI